MFETFGPVSRPFYSVRFNTAEEIDRERAKVGSRVFYVPSYNKSALVQVEELKKMKYTDASNAFDEEVEEHEREFSDDEEELSYRQMLKRSTAKSNRQQQQPRQQRLRRAPLPPKDDDDFDAALAAYDASKNTQSQAQSSGRQMVSYDEDL